MEQVKKVLESRMKPYKYVMYENIVKVVDKEENEIKQFPLPSDIRNAICFHDMYYCLDHVALIVATRDCYDSRLLVDENKLEIVSGGFDK